MATLSKEYLTAYRKKPHAKAARAWESMNRKARNDDGLHPTYAAVEVRMTRDQFLAWAVPAFEAWMAQNPGKSPAVGRIGHVGHYELGNIVVTEFEPHRLEMARYKNLNGRPAGQSWCSWHKAYHPVCEFRGHTRQVTGCQGYCIVGMREYNQERNRKRNKKRR